MAGATAQDVIDLVKLVESTGQFQVADLGQRFRITNPLGGAPVFIDRRPPRGNTLKAKRDALAAIGFNEVTAQEAADRRRQERLNLDRVRNEEKTARAEQDARMRAEQIERIAADRAAAVLELAAQEKIIREERPARAELLARDAPVVLGGYRKDYIEVTLSYAEGVLRRHNVAWKATGRSDEETNRRVDPRTVADYASSMARGKWYHHHQGVAVDTLGRLADGQQRLMGLVLANQPGFLESLGLDPELAGTISFWTEITYDVDPSAVSTMDQGRRRSKAVMLGMRGERNTLQLEAGLKLVHLYDSVPYSRIGWFRYQMPVDVMWDVLAEHPGMRDTISRASKYSRWTVTSSLGAMLYLVQRKADGLYDAELEEFLDGIYTGLNMTSEGDPRMALRSLREKRSRRHRVTSIDGLAVLIKAWNKFLERGTFGKGGLRFRADVEPFPRINRLDDAA